MVCYNEKANLRRTFYHGNPNISTASVRLDLSFSGYIKLIKVLLYINIYYTFPYQLFVLLIRLSTTFNAEWVDENILIGASDIT